MIDPSDIGKKARELHTKIDQRWPIDELDDAYMRALSAVAALTGPIDDLAHVGLEVELPAPNREGGTFTIYALHDDYIVLASGAAARIVPWRRLESLNVIVKDWRSDEPQASSVLLGFLGLDGTVTLERKTFSREAIAWVTARAKRAFVG